MTALSVANRLAFVGSYLRTRALCAHFTQRARIERWQARQIERLRRHALAQIGFYRRLGDAPFARFPILDKAQVMAQFDAFNTLKLDAGRAWRALEAGDPPPGFDIGCSTGTSGNRGLYLVSDRERFMWLGAIVAKALPDAWRRPHRVAIVLPRASRLYEAANESRLMRLRFFDLREGLDAIGAALAAFAPTVVVAPPKALRWMAEHDVAIAPAHLYAGAEVLDAPDRAVIEARYRLRLGQIYMATEGLLGVTCRFGTLHLAEDTTLFELEPVGERLVSPLITDFMRRTQVMARYRMNDVLRLAPLPCPCGCAMQAVEEVVGRRDDCFELPAREGGRTILITPDVLRNAILAADARIADFRLRQIGENEVELLLPLDAPAPVLDAATQSLAGTFDALRVAPTTRVRRDPLEITLARKIRRVERRWLPERDAGP